jgi:hypothetical protein
VPELGYGLYCDVYRPDLTPLLTAIGAQFPFSCTFSSTYVGPATDSEGNVLTEPTYLFGGRCDTVIDKLHLTLHDTFVKMCRDSSGRGCAVTTTRQERDTALFPYMIAAGMDWSLSIGGDPPLQRGDKVEVVIDLVDGGQVHYDQVM